MKNSLLNCPFCGKPPDIINGDNRDDYIYIMCRNDDCCADMGPHHSIDEAVLAWNKRCPLDDMPEPVTSGSFSKMIQKFENVVSGKGSNNE